MQGTGRLGVDKCLLEKHGVESALPGEKSTTAQREDAGDYRPALPEQLQRVRSPSGVSSLAAWGCGDEVENSASGVPTASLYEGRNGHVTKKVGPRGLERLSPSRLFDIHSAKCNTTSAVVVRFVWKTLITGSNYCYQGSDNSFTGVLV